MMDLNATKCLNPKKLIFEKWVEDGALMNESQSPEVDARALWD